MTNKNNFCTIATYNYLFKVRTLRDSLLLHHKHLNFDVLIVDKVLDKEELEKSPKNRYLNFFYPEDLVFDSRTQKIINKYTKLDFRRWSLKPIFLKYLLLQKKRNRVIYLDNDICFFGNAQFLFELLDKDRALLSPHWHLADPFQTKESFHFTYNFLHGLYNAGFFGANQKSIPILDWWANSTSYRCEFSTKEGFFVDQRYLDLIPVIFENVRIIRHKGCNVAHWNYWDCRRTLVDNRVKINKKFDIIFIHFTEMTIEKIVIKFDDLLQPFLQQYFHMMDKYNSSYSVKAIEKAKRLQKLREHWQHWAFIPTYFPFVRRWIRKWLS